MAKSSSKNGPKAVRSASNLSTIPAPFSKAPASLATFVERLDPTKVYITHMDRHHPDYKKRIFLIPLFLNASIAVLLAYRTYCAAPTYLAMVQTMLGYHSSATVDVENTTRRYQFGVLFRRTAMLIMDYLLARYVGPWPFTFFFEQPTNPVTYRYKVGFRTKEVVVRVSRWWGSKDLMEGVKQGQQNAFFKTRILPAISKETMQKTGYLMMDGSWDLEFELMQDAHSLAEQHKTLQIFDLDKIVFTHMAGIGWVIWQWETESEGLENRRKQVVIFKDRLTVMGKESLFWKWAEIVEEFKSEDNGLVALERRRQLTDKIQSVFEENGVDFENLVQEIGFSDALPEG